MDRQANIQEYRVLAKEGETRGWRMAELAAAAVADGMSQRAYAHAVGESQRHIGVQVRMWDRWGEGEPPHRPPFGDAYETIKSASTELVPAGEGRSRRAQRQVPKRHNDRVEMASKLLADPEVAKVAVPAVLQESSQAQRVIEQSVSRKQAADRKRQAEAATRRREGEAMPLPAYMHKMVIKMNEWAAGLASIEIDLGQLPDGRGREMVLDALGELAKQTQRCINRLETVAELNVIEGEAR